MSLDKFFKNKSKKDKSMTNKTSDADKKQESNEIIKLNPNQGKNTISDITKQSLNPNTDKLGESELKIDSINRNELLLSLEKKFATHTKRELLEGIIDMIHSNPLYVTHKNLIGSLLKLENESPDFEKFTIQEIAFELNLNEMYVKVLLTEIQLFW